MKIIYDPVKNKSKGFGFVEFTNYKEFNKALNNKTPVFLGKQKLVFNSGKNRYDELDDINSVENNYILHNDSNISQTLTQQSSTTEIGNSISNFNNSFLTHSSKNSFVEDIAAYNNNITNYNKWLDSKNDTTSIKLEKYDTKKTYIDFNKDGDYSGKGVNDSEKIKKNENESGQAQEK